jgi:hypothetical protein
MLLWQKMAEESAIRCCTSAVMDWKTVQHRVKHEGLSFLTITLPAFGKDFERSLELGQVENHLFSTSTSWKKGRGGLPLFLGGFLSQVFDTTSGKLLNDPNIDAILSVRQLTLMFSKIFLPCSDARTRKAMDGYIQCELDIRRCDSSRPGFLNRDFSAASQALFARAFSEVDRKVYHTEVIPKHGPGATADNLSGNRKYEQRTWTTRLEKIFPAGEFLLPNWSYYDHMEEVDIREPGQEEPVKVIPVPKTLKTPRIIAKEPTCMQYMQQAILPEILESLRNDKFLRDMLGFDDQTPNQRMALKGSLYGSLATLDLSEASDRVSNQLVVLMLKNHPHLHGAVQATRSMLADVPGHGVIPLAKFASMGSALTFPVEAMVFLAITISAISKSLSLPVSRELLQELHGRVRIYGDDIIVPVDHVHVVIAELEAFGLKVNTGKSFWNGKFRESCGKEYYDGYDVSIVKVRREFPTSRQCVAEVISLVSLRNQLYYGGYWQTVKWLDGLIGKMIHHFPVVEPTSSALGRFSYLRGYETQRIDERLHAPRVRGWSVTPVIPADKLDGMGALLKFFLKRGGLPSVDEKHLERAGRAQSLQLKLGWVQPF